jgi:Variant SH3 domain
MTTPVELPSLDFSGGLGEDILTINKSLYDAIKTSTEMIPKKVAAAEEEEGAYQLAKVLKDYSPKDQSELQLEESDIIRIYPAKTVNNRYYGSVNGSKGYFPSQNVKILQETDETAVVDDDEEEDLPAQDAGKHEKKSSSSWFSNSSSKKSSLDAMSPKTEKIEPKRKI